jgi:membrane-associated protein
VSSPETESSAEEAGEAADQGKPEEKSPWEDPRMLWTGKPGKADILCLLGILFSGVYSLAVLPFRASLVGHHPVWSELINGSTEAIISAASFARVGHGTLAVAVIAAIPGLMKFDILYWWAGRLWGEKYILMLSGKSQRGIKWMHRVRRSGRKFLWPAIVASPFIPFGFILYVIAGWAGMSWIAFLLLDLVGNLLWTGMLVGLGYALGQHGVDIAQTISHYGLYVTIGLIVVVVFFQIRNQRRMLSDTAASAREAVRVVEDDTGH